MVLQSARWGLLALLGLVLPAGALAQPASAPAPQAAASAPPPPPRDARNAQFWKRIDNPAPNPMAAPRSWYQPAATVQGAPGAFLPAAAPGKTRIAAWALDEASQYAEATGAQALIIVHRGVVQLERYYGGFAAASQFSSHSIAKTLGAMAVAAAIDDGRIASLDEPASKWLPEWRDDKRQAITLRQLVEMSSGLSTPPSKELGSHYIQMHYGADVEAIVRDAVPSKPPGSTFAFDNDNAHALGLVIERATGLPYHEYLSRRIWQRLGAADAQVVLDREGGRAYAYCCVWSLPRDWVRVGQSLLDGGRWQGQRVLSEAQVKAMFQPSRVNPHVGLQLFLGSAWLNPQVNRFLKAQQATLAPSVAADLAYASGYGGQLLALVPSEQLLILRVGKYAPAWRDHVLPNLLVTALRGDRSAKAWEWLYDWRLSTRGTPDPLPRFDPQSPVYWPGERVAGAAQVTPLPRRDGTCLNAERMVQAQTEVERTNSSAFLVWRNGAIEHEWYGPGQSGQTRADTASLHKSVLGLLYGQAVADKAIPSLDLPVSRWITEWAGDARGAITLRQLLQMASGLAPLKFDAAPGSAWSRALHGADSTLAPLGATLADTPGQTFNYASTVSQLLGLVLERATGQRYAQYLSRRLWQPLGAADAHVALDRPGGLARTSSSLMARPEDWLRLGLLFVERGRVNGRAVMDAKWLDAMSAASPANPNYGLHLWRGSPHAAQRRYYASSPIGVPAREPFLAEDMVYFDGAGAQRVYASPREKLVIVRIGAASFDWDDSLLPNLVVAAARQCR